MYIYITGSQAFASSIEGALRFGRGFGVSGSWGYGVGMWLQGLFGVWQLFLRCLNDRARAIVDGRRPNIEG